ncbi:MAG: DegV family protein [Oscillospiraceae bacterium]|nr:DegV family protein [Oscillospiraceae bacterium]
MSKIAILTDSSCDIPVELEQKYGIDILCFPITLDGVSYTERKDFTPEEFYDMMRQAKGVPTTAAITSLRFVEKFCEYVDEGYTEVLAVLINGTGSATYNNAVMAAEQLREERPGHKMKIHLVDARTYSMVFGWYVCEAARKIRNGAEVGHVKAELEKQMACNEICLAAFSLKQMKKSGRISAAAAFAGELLGLRPIISLNDGVSVVQSKVRGDASVVPAMIKYVTSRVEDVKEMEYQIGYTDHPMKDELIKQCKKAFGHPPVNTFLLGSVVSANTGPDAIAIAFSGSDRGPRNL